jgi:dTMP kinase
MAGMQSRVIPNFVVFEGIDGSGTTTQLSLLSQRLGAGAIPYYATSEPTHGPVGGLIHSVLSGSLELAAETLAFLFAADRNEHLYHGTECITANAEKQLVICDRYLFSSLAYQSVDCDFNFVASLNSGFPLPEIVFYIDTPLDICARRRSGRTDTQIFETDDYQRKVLGQYEKALARFAETPMRLVCLNGAREKQEISEEVWKFISTMPIVKG